MMSDVGGSSGNASDFKSGRLGFESLREENDMKQDFSRIIHI